MPRAGLVTCSGRGNEMARNYFGSTYCKNIYPSGERKAPGETKTSGFAFDNDSNFDKFVVAVCKARGLDPVDVQALLDKTDRAKWKMLKINGFRTTKQITVVAYAR
jgi:hypothetical protein